MTTGMFELNEPSNSAAQPNIKVIGLGGGGGNAVDNMIAAGLSGIEFIAANTDAQALAQNRAPVKLQFGRNGLGAGANPEKGREAAASESEAIKELIGDADMVFIAAGMGGGTGTGSAPVVAQIAQEMGVLTVGVVTRPFTFENRREVAEKGIEELSKHVDSLITVPNEKLIQVLGGDFILSKAFEYANDVLLSAVQGITDVVNRWGFINLDFEDLRTVMQEKGYAMMGIGEAEGDDRVTKALQEAISNPLLADTAVHNAKAILVNVTGGDDFKIDDINKVADLVQQMSSPQCRVIYGHVHDETIGKGCRITVIATGLTPTGETMPTTEQDPQRFSATSTNSPSYSGQQPNMNQANGTSGSAYYQQPVRPITPSQPPQTQNFSQTDGHQASATGYYQPA